MSRTLSTPVKRSTATRLAARESVLAQLPFELLQPKLSDGCRVLDVGAGRTPFLAPDLRPQGCEYVGLDLSRAELEAAPAGSYDDFVVGSVCEPYETLRDRFDIVISWQLLEHVKPLDDALENVRSYLRPGGQFLGWLSGAFSYFALASRVLPIGVTRAILRFAQGRDPATVFPAHYHHCWDSALRRALSAWSSAEVVPLWRGDVYLGRFPALVTLNTHYERWAMNRHFDDLATHYLIDARR